MDENLKEKLICDIQRLGQKYPINKIVLFGSRARGDFKVTSDIDLAIFPLPEFKSQGHFASDIDELETLLKIDIVFVNENTELKLLDNIKREGVIIYERL